MKKLSKYCLTLCSLLVSYSSVADWATPLYFNPYLAADFNFYTRMNGRGVWKNFMPSSPYNGGSFNGGARFHDYFALELGSDWHRERRRNIPLFDGSPFFGGVVPVGQGFTSQVAVRRSGYFGDIVGYYPLAECVELLGYVGVNYIRPRVNYRINSIFPPTPTSTILASISGKRTGVLRAGVGLSFMITEWIGLRGKLGFENTARLKVRGNSAFVTSRITNKPFQNSFTASIGIVGYFFNSCCP